MKKILLMTLVSFLLNGCVSISDMHLKLASSDEKFAQTQLQQLDVKETVIGTDCVSIILIPLGSPPTMDEAWADALKKAPGAVALADSVVKNELLFTFFYNRACVKVEGKPVYPKKEQ